MSLLGLIGTGVSAAGGLISTMLNNKAQRESDERNLEFQRENLDYQKAIQQKIFDREDTAHQREVADLRSAGLNPLLSTGSGAGAGAVVPTEALHSSYVPNYSGVAQGFASAGQALASYDRWNEELKLKQEMQKEQILKMKTDRQKTVADTMNSILGYKQGSASYDEFMFSADYREEARKLDNEYKKLSNLEKSGQISHAEARNRREELASKREELASSREQGVYEHNIKYARDHNRPYGQATQGLEYLADTIARIFHREDGGVSMARDIVDSMSGKLGLGDSDSARVMRMIDTVAGYDMPYSDKVKALEDAAKQNGLKVEPSDLKRLHDSHTKSIQQKAKEKEKYLKKLNKHPKDGGSHR